MASPTSSFLSVPITEAERRANQQRLREDTESLLASPTRHARDAQFDPQVGRYRSLRRAGEKYDDPNESYQTYDERGQRLGSIDETSLDAPEPTQYSPVDGVPKPHRLASSVYSNNVYEPMRSTGLPPSDFKTQAPIQPLSQPKYWQPRWLRRSALVVLGFLMAGCVAGLLVTCWYADEHNGYHIANPNDHYAWTYGPTAVMVLIVALWRQVDYNAKLLHPWHALRNGPAMPHSSILMDYISPFQLVSFYTALKRAHIPIVLTITAFFLSKLTTIAATGLFQVRQHNFDDRFSAIPTRIFDASASGNSVFGDETVAAAAVHKFYGNVFNGLNFSTGVQADFAYAPLQLVTQSVSVPPNATFNGTTDTFVPSINCSSVNITFNGPSTLAPNNITYNSTSSPFGDGNLNFTINNNNLCQTWPTLMTHAIDPVHYIAPPKQIEGTLQNVYCADSSGRVPNDAQPVGLLFTLTEIDYSQGLLTNVSRPQGGGLPIALNVSRTVPRIENTLCVPGYTLSQANFTKDTTFEDPGGITLNKIPNPRNATLPDLTTADLIQAFGTALSATSDLFADITEQDNQTFVVRTGPFDLLGVVAQTNENITLFDFDTINGAIQKTYKGTMSHFADSALSRAVSANATQNTSMASISWEEPRLYVNHDPLYFMVACLGTMAIIAFILAFIAPQAVLPRDPGPIATNATILTRSVELNRLLRRARQPNKVSLPAALNGYSVGTAIASTTEGVSSFKIHVSKGHTLRHDVNSDSDSKFWHPYTASLPVLALTVAISFGIIAVLAVVQQMSKKNQGLLDVSDDSTTTFASRYIPVLVFLLVASMINNLDFYIALFSPWAAMRKVKATAQRSVLTNVVGRFPPTAVSETIRGKYLGALLSTCGALLASLLSIIASDLYLIKDFDMSGPTQTVSRLDTFDLGTSYLVDNDNGAASILGLIQSNSTFPAFTFAEYAFPNMTLGPAPTDIRPGTSLVGSLKGTIPALRANLTCDILNNVDGAMTDEIVVVSAVYDLPRECTDGLTNLNSTTLELETNFTMSDGNFAGRLLDLRFGTNSSTYGHVGEANSTLVANNPAIGCPSLAFLWGDLMAQHSQNGPINIAVCYQLIEEVNVNVTFQENSTQFDPSAPPFATNTAINATVNPNSTTGSKTYDFRIQSNLVRELGVDNTTRNGTSNIDAFFQTLINGTQGVSITTLESSPDVAVAAITSLYQQYMAQVFSSSFRRPLSTTNTRLTRRQSDTDSHLADLQTIITVPRLVQNEPSTIALQVVLGVAVLLLAGGYFLTKMRNILPVNPCSIAGTMSLLAGSDLCHSHDDGVCDCCGKKRRGSFNHEGDSESYIEAIHAEDDEHDDIIHDKKQIIPSGAEWMDHIDFNRVFGAHRYTLQDWPEDPKHGKRARYGVDIDAEGEWSLGRRRQSDTFDDFAEQSANPSLQRGRSWSSRSAGARGRYARADVSPGDEAHEMTIMSGARPDQLK